MDNEQLDTIEMACERAIEGGHPAIIEVSGGDVATVLELVKRHREAQPSPVSGETALEMLRKCEKVLERIEKLSFDLRDEGAGDKIYDIAQALRSELSEHLKVTSTGAHKGGK